MDRQLLYAITAAGLRGDTCPVCLPVIVQRRTHYLLVL